MGELNAGKRRLISDEESETLEFKKSTSELKEGIISIPEQPLISPLHGKTTFYSFLIQNIYTFG